MDKVPDVDIDSGTFKYILIKVHDKNDDTSKYIVRGYKRAGYHGDILDEVTPKIEDGGILETECVGGGRIQHDLDKKSIKVYGYSQGYGRADHSITCDLLRQQYPDYKDVSFSNDGY